jgi:hypothetical protein
LPKKHSWESKEFFFYDTRVIFGMVSFSTHRIATCAHQIQWTKVMNMIPVEKLCLGDIPLGPLITRIFHLWTSYLQGLNQSKTNVDKNNYKKFNSTSIKNKCRKCNISSNSYKSDYCKLKCSKTNFDSLEPF